MSVKNTDPLQALADALPEHLLERVAAAAEKLHMPPKEYVSRVLGESSAQVLSPNAKSDASMARDNAVYLSAPVSALVEGLYRQSTTLLELKQWGDFGLGTFNDLDGEMLLMDGDVYQMRADGHVSRLDARDLGEIRTPFACVTFFRADTYDDVTPEMGTPELFSLLESILPSPNMLYAIRIEGRFSDVRVRSVPRQEVQRPLAEVAKEQPEFIFKETVGSMVGFYTPPMMQGLNVPGLHMHFVDASGEHGGHLLASLVTEGRISVQHVPRLMASLPVSLDYLTADFTRDVGKDLDAAER